MKRSLPALAIAPVVLAVAALVSSTTLAGYGGPARQTHGEGLKAFGAHWFALSAAGSKKVAKGGS